MSEPTRSIRAIPAVFLVPVLLFSIVAVAVFPQVAGAASGPPLPACLARKLHVASSVCRLALDVADVDRMGRQLARGWKLAEARAASVGADCRTGTATAADIQLELSEGSAWGAFIILAKVNYRETECRRRGIRPLFHLAARTCADVLTAEARLAREPNARRAEVLAEVRAAARERIEALLQVYAPLGCNPDGLTDAIMGLIDTVARDIAP